MIKDLYIYISDTDSSTAFDDKVEQTELFEKIQDVSDENNEVKPTPTTHMFVLDGAETEITNAVISGLSWPALITSAGFFLKQLSPLLIEFMRSRVQKEMTFEIKGVKVTLNGGGDFEKELKKVVSELEVLNEKDSIYKK